MGCCFFFVFVVVVLLSTRKKERNCEHNLERVMLLNLQFECARLKRNTCHLLRRISIYRRCMCTNLRMNNTLSSELNLTVRTYVHETKIKYYSNLYPNPNPK